MCDFPINTRERRARFQALSELQRTITAPVLDVFQFELLEPAGMSGSVKLQAISHITTRGERQLSWPNLPLTFAVKVDAIDLPLHLVKTNVVESLKTSAAYCSYSMVRHQEVFFPTHEDVLALCHVLDDNGGTPARLFRVRTEGGKFGPVRQVCFVIGTPAFMLGHEAVLRADDLPLEIRGQSWMVVCET